MGAQQVLRLEVLARILARPVVAAADCSMGCRDPNRSPRGSWEEDMIQSALARQKFAGSILEVEERETGRMWKRPCWRQ